MRSICLYLFIALFTTSALAFGGGGGGSGRKGVDRTRKEYGIHAVGGHIDPDHPIDPPIWNCDDPNAHPSDEGVCVCNDGYVEDADNTCVVNQCTDFTPTDCITACDPPTGNKTYATLCHNDEYYCNDSHQCVNPCDGESYDSECATCTPQGQSADIQPKSGTCGTGGNWICQAGECTDPCTIGEHLTDDCTLSWHADNGICTPDYADAGTTCGKDKICDGNGVCNCNSKYLLNTDNTCTICANGNVYLSYLSDPCSRVIDGFTGCKSNKECLDSLGEGYYCRLTGSSCNYPTTGTCTEIGSPTTANITGLGSVVRSASSLQWWSAQNWCKAQGKNLIDVAEFECYRNGTTKIVKDSSTGFCCAQEQTCSNWSSYWSGSTIPDDKAVKYSSIFVALRKKFGTGTFWTDSRVGYDNCRAFYGTLSEAAMYSGSRDSWNRAICK